MTPIMKNLFTTLTILLFATIVFGQNSYDIVTKPSKFSDKVKTRSNFAKEFPFINPVDWKMGVKFMTVPLRDRSTDSYSTINLSPYQSKNSYDSKIKQSDFQWKIFTYLGLEVRTVNCPRGICKRTYLLFDCESNKYEYEYIGDTTELRNSKGIDNSIYNLVYLDEVDSVKSKLVGKKIYIITSQWMKDDESGVGRYSIKNPKFVAVKITSVGLGSQDAPSKIVFKQIGTETEAYLNIRLSGINAKSGNTGFEFDKVFRFEDPKLNYPNISSSVWSSIQNGKVYAGMTKQECELAWGKPKDIINTIIGKDNREQWVYNLSSYLYFKNGVLETIQY